MLIRRFWRRKYSPLGMAIKRPTWTVLSRSRVHTAVISERILKIHEGANHLLNSLMSSGGGGKDAHHCRKGLILRGGCGDENFADIAALSDLWRCGTKRQ